MFKSVCGFFLGLFKCGSGGGVNGKHDELLPGVTFESLDVKADNISEEDVGEYDFLCREHNNKKKWIMFRCPCKCGDVITLSLQQIHTPCWRLGLTSKNRPTLYPSVWRDQGCFSHFWVKDGRVYWCNNTGFPPQY